MAGLFLVRAERPEFAREALASARAHFGLHGFSGLSERTLSGWHLIHAPHIIGGPESLLEAGDDLVAVAGTLTCDGKMGRQALEGLLAMDLPRLDWSRLGGQFIALVHKAGRTFLFTDYFAAFQLFHDSGFRLFSTSFLSAVNALPQVSFDPQSVYEFAFNVVPIGDDTVFSELKMLGPEKVAELTVGGVVLHHTAKPLPEAAVRMPIEERVELHKERLGAVVRSYIAGFDRVFAALSGGLDSRLVLASLREQGCRASVYVYGPPTSIDVQIARHVGEAEGFEVECVDKEASRQLEPDGFAGRVERNYWEYDALPNFGELFENGANAAARDARHAGGALSASGGCGEVFRNFFFLPDKPLPVSVVARSFFARYDPGDTTEMFDGRQFLSAIEHKIRAVLGAQGAHEALPRTVIEQIYPRVRCRSIFGKEISLENRYGAYLMPFLDHQLVGEAMRLPIALKNAGRFEAMLLAAIDPALARLPSAYGHDFASPPSFRHRFNEWSTRVRPAWLRQKTYSLRRRLGPMEDEHGGLLTPEYMGRVIDLDYPVMRRFFRPERINDSSVMRRVACLEYLAAKLGSRLRH